MKRFLWAGAALVVAILFLSGCQARQESAESPFADEDAEHLLVCVLDLSGSYSELMLGPNGKAYQQFVRIKDAYFRDRAGSGDRMILSQISATNNALLWDGKPRSFVRDFPTPESFKQFLVSKSNPNGSRVYNSIADSIDYLVMQHENSPKLKSAVLVFSDMEDNDPDPKGKPRLLDSLKSYGKKGGIVGMYWVTPTLISEWSNALRDSGLKYSKIEPEFRADPTLPMFD